MLLLPSAGGNVDILDTKFSKNPDERETRLCSRLKSANVERSHYKMLKRRSLFNLSVQKLDFFLQLPFVRLTLSAASDMNAVHIFSFNIKYCLKMKIALM